MGVLGGHGDFRGWDFPEKFVRKFLCSLKVSELPRSLANPKSAVKSMKKVLSRMWKKWKFSYCCSYHLSNKGRQYTFTRISLLRCGGGGGGKPKQESFVSSQESCSRVRCRDKLFRKQRKATFFATFFLTISFSLLSWMFYSVSDVKRWKKLCERV